MDLLRRLFAFRRRISRLHGRSGLLLRIFLLRLLLLLLQIGGSKGADSTLRSAPLSLPFHFCPARENACE